VGTICDLIEAHLKLLLEQSQGDPIQVQRSELAERFGCAPSQINYVLATRFRTEGGYLVESRRGGKGFLRIVRMRGEVSEELAGMAGQPKQMSQEAVECYVNRLLEQGMVTEREAALMRSAMHRSVLKLDLPDRDEVRARIFRAMLRSLLQQ
jgi:transcriptional regulator CtsR